MGKIQWTGYHLDLLRKEYPEKGINIPELRKKFSISGIRTKAHRLGIHYNNITLSKYHKWTKQEIEIIKKEYPKKGVNIPNLIERHGKGGIESKARNLGIRCDFASKQWTKKEDKLLVGNYSELGTKIPDLLKTRTSRAIMQRARILSITFEGEPEKIYDIPKEVLYDLYVVQQKSSNTIAKKYGCTTDTIRNRMFEYGIPYRDRRDAVIISKGGLAHIKLNDYIKQVFDGVMISDGYIDVVGKIDTITGSLVVNQAEKNRDWIKNLCNLFNQNGLSCNIHQRKAKLLGKEFRQLSLQSSSYVEIGNERKRWYPDGKKIVPRDIQFTPVFLAHWFMGDGLSGKRYSEKLDRNYYQLVFCTDGFTKEDVEFLIHKINDIYGYHFKIKKQREGYRLQNSRMSEIKDFLYKISPYIVDCFQYKIKALYDPKAKIDRKNWTKNQEKILRSEYPTCGENIPSLIRQGKTKSAIGSKAFIFGIKHKRRYWTNEMLQILKDKYPELGSYIPELIELGKTRYAIKQKARGLGIRYKYYMNQFGKYQK